MSAAVVLLYIVSVAAILALGFMIGVVATVSYISRQMKKAQSELERQLAKLMLPPPSEGENWKKGKLEAEDENWLRRRLDDDKNKETK